MSIQTLALTAQTLKNNFLLSTDPCTKEDKESGGVVVEHLTWY